MSVQKEDYTLGVLEDVCGTKVKVETVKGATYTGILTKVDHVHGDMELSDVRVQERDSSVAIVERVFVPGKSVRLVAITGALKAALTAKVSTTQYAETLRKSLKRVQAKGSAGDMLGKAKRSTKPSRKPKVDATKRKMEQRVRKLKKQQ